MKFARLASMAIPLAVLGLVLAVPVPRGHGADEVAFLALDPMRVGHGDQFVQPVPAQARDLSGIQLPYRVSGRGTADLEVSLRAPDGALLESRRLLLHEPDWWDALSGTFSQYGPGVQEVLIPVPVAGAAGADLVVRRTGGAADLTLFFSRAGGQRLPDLESAAGRSLALRTEYGGRRPALLRAPDILPRVERWAPPWLPPGALLLALAMFVMGGLALVQET